MLLPLAPFSMIFFYECTVARRIKNKKVRREWWFLDGWKLAVWGEGAFQRERGRLWSVGTTNLPPEQPFPTKPVLAYRPPMCMHRKWHKTRGATLYTPGSGQGSTLQDAHTQKKSKRLWYKIGADRIRYK